MRYSYCLVVILFFAVSAFSKAGEVLLDGFEKEGALGSWKLRNVEGELVTENATQGRRSARLFFRERDSQAWSRAILTLDGSLVPRSDWAPFEELLFDVTNKSEKVIELRAGLNSTGSQRVASGTFLVEPGKTETCRVPVSHIYRKATPAYQAREEKTTKDAIQSLDFYLLAIAEDELYLDNVRLVANELRALEAGLWNDPFGTGQVTVFCKLNRAALCDVRIHDSSGALMARHVSTTDRLNWRWDDSEALRTMAPGMYRAKLVLTDVKWKPDVSQERDLGSFEIISESEAADVAVWSVPSTRKAMLYSRPGLEQAVFLWQEKGRLLGPDEPIRIEMARNEFEGVQIVFLSRNEVRRINVEVESLQLAGTRESFPLEQSDILQVGYVKTKDPLYYEVDHIGWWPDALMPATQMYAKPGECMPVWVNMKSNTDTEPGLYLGELAVTVNGSKAGFLPFEVYVHDVPIPTETTIRTAFATYDGLIREIHGGKLPKGMLRKYHQLIADHRLNVDNIYRSTPPEIETLEFFNERGQLNAFNLKYIGGRVEARDRINSQEYLDSLAEMLDPYVDQLRQRGLAEKAYLYGFDEIGGEMYEVVKRVFGFLKERYPEIPTMTTGRDPSFGVDSGLEDEVDIWVPLTPAYNIELARAARERGKEVWWYICISPPHPYANWFVEYPALEPRLLWWMTYQQQVPGFLYYLTNLRHNQSELMIVNGYNKTNWNPASWRTANGDGCLIYSGPDGPISTIRFENLRDGIEDTELLFLLEKRLGDGGAEALKYCEQLVPSLTNYTDDVRHFASIRGQLLRRLEELPSE